MQAAFAPSALAQPAPPAGSGAREDQRSALYKEGVDAAAAGRWAQAKERFAAVLAIRASPKTHFSLAQAEEHLGQIAEALEHYRLALDGAKAAGEDEVVAESKKSITALEPRVPSVRIVASGATGATATLDGAKTPIGEPVRVDPGDHRVEVTAPGTRTERVSVAIGEQQHLDVPVNLVGTAASTPPAPSPAEGAVQPRRVDARAPTAGEPSPEDRAPTGGWSGWKTAALVTGGAGIVALGVGTYFGIDAKNKYDQSNSSGCQGDHCTPTAASIRRDALSSATASTVGFVAGGVLLAGGVVLWLVAPSPKGEVRVGLTPTFSPAGIIGLSVDGCWR